MRELAWRRLQGFLCRGGPAGGGPGLEGRRRWRRAGGVSPAGAAGRLPCLLDVLKLSPDLSRLCWGFVFVSAGKGGAVRGRMSGGTVGPEREEKRGGGRRRNRAWRHASTTLRYAQRVPKWCKELESIVRQTHHPLHGTMVLNDESFTTPFPRST